MMKKLGSRELKSIIGNILKEELQRAKNLNEAPEDVDPGNLYKSDEYLGKTSPQTQKQPETGELDVEKFVQSIEDELHDQLLEITDGLAYKVMKKAYKIAAFSLFNQGFKAHFRNPDQLAKELADVEEEAGELNDSIPDFMDFEADVRVAAVELSKETLRTVLTFYKDYVIDSGR